MPSFGSPFSGLAKVAHAGLTIGGFLGMGEKLLAVT